MKKLFLLALPFISVTLNAEQLRFVTVLSSPVGTFNRLEAVDSETTVKSPVINFCTKLGNGGTVTLQGKNSTVHPEVTALNLSNATTLGGNGNDYILNTLTMKQGGTLKGSRLLANVMQVANGGMGVSANLYSNSLTVAGAKAQMLDVNNGESKITEHHSSTDMVWSNEYQSDKACGTQAECAKQYLLKQKSGVAAVCTAGETREIAEQCSLSAPEMIPNNGCGRIQEYCDAGGWKRGGCVLGSGNECWSGQTKKECRSTAGQTNCVEYTCVGCKWKSGSSGKKWTVSSESYDYDTRRGHPWFQFCDLGKPSMTKSVSVCLLEHAPVTGGYKTTAVPSAGSSCSTSYPDRFLTGCSVSGKIYDSSGKERDCYYAGTGGFTTYTVTYQTLECK